MSDPFLGEVRMFAGNFAPLGWLACNGQLVSIAENDALYTLLGTTYGGDGVTIFGLPDLRGRVPLHAGTGPGLGTYTQGEMLGSESVTLITAQLPAHTHIAMANATATSLSPANAVWAAASGVNIYGTATPNATMSAAAIAPGGGSQPHDNMAPYLAVTFIIATAGIYPPQP